MKNIFICFVLTIFFLTFSTCKKNDDELREAILGYWEVYEYLDVTNTSSYLFFDKDSVSESWALKFCDYDINDFKIKHKYIIIDRYLYIQEDSKKFTMYKIKFLRDSEANIYSMNIYRKKIKLERFDGNKRVFIKCN